MFHPLQDNINDLKDQELENKLQELTKKYFIAQRLGQTDLLTQLSTFVNIYKAELSRRHLDRTRKDLDGDLDKLINVD
jgi:hypothetical protein